MKRTVSALLAMTLAAAVLSAPVMARADALNEARQLIEARKYDQVDKKLAGLIKGTKPNVEALRLSMQAAEAAGRYVTAEQRAGKLLEITDNKDLGLVFQAARIAHRAGEFRRALGRYDFYIRQSEKASDDLREACTYMLQRGPYPTIYQKYLKLFGTGRASWALGYEQMERTRRSRDTEAFFAVAEPVMKAFGSDPGKARAVHYQIYDGFRDNHLSRDADAYVQALKIMAMGRPSDQKFLYEVFRDATRRVKDGREYVALVLAQKNYGQPLSEELMDAFDNIGRIENADIRRKVAETLAGMDDLFKKAGTSTYSKYLWEMLSDPDGFAKGEKPVLSPQEVLKRLDALAKMADTTGGTPWWMHNHVEQAVRYFMGGDKKLQAALLGRFVTSLESDEFALLLSLTEGKKIDQQLKAVLDSRDYLSGIYYRFAALPAWNELAKPLTSSVIDAREAAEKAENNVAKAKSSADAATKALASAKKAKDKDKIAAAEKSLKEARQAVKEAEKAYKQAEQKVDQAEKALASKAGKYADAITSAAREYMLVRPGQMNTDQLKTGFFYSMVVPREKRLAVLKEAIETAGRTKHLQDLVNQLKRDRKNWGGRKDFEAVAGLLAKAKPQDPLVAFFSDVEELGHPNHFKKEHLERIRKLLAGAKGPVLGTGKASENLREAQWRRAFDEHLWSAWSDRGGMDRFIATWREKIGPDARWHDVARRANQLGRHHAVGNWARSYIQAIGKGPGSDDVWNELAEAANAKGDANSIFAGVYEKMGWGNALEYIYNQGQSYDTDNRQKWADEFGKLAGMKGFAFPDFEQLNDMVNEMQQDWCRHHKVKFPVNFLDAAWDYYLKSGDRAQKQANAWFEGRLYLMYRYSSGKAAAKMLSDLRKRLLARRDAGGVIDTYGVMFQHDVAPPAGEAGKLEPGSRYHLAAVEMPELYRQVAEDGLAGLRVWTDVVGSADWLARTEDEGWEAHNAQGREALKTMSEMVADGAEYHGSDRDKMHQLENAVRFAAADKDSTLLAKLLPVYANYVDEHHNWDRSFSYQIEPVVKELQSAGYDQMVYSFTTSVMKKHSLPEGLAKRLNVIRSQASQDIAGMIPVDKSDPAYDLHLASRMLILGDQTRAWTLTRPKLELLPKVWESLDPDYVVWVIDQLRFQKKLPEALELAFTVLLRENQLPAEVAARVLLLKGDIYRDMQNYRAARVEYQSLRANDRYRNTAGGRDALYHLVDLYITMGDYGSAEEIVERLVESDDVRVQAEAYFLNAKMAFAQEDYETAAGYIREVKTRVVDHVEAGFLEGELKLKLTSGLQDPEVEVGPQELRTVVIPGRVLNMVLRDNNLSVARGSKAVPVVVRSSGSGDEEFVDLIPSGSDRYLFSGQIKTSLGAPRKGNATLEVLGDDQVSYQITEQFQKDNDLNYPPKNLVVKADGELMASSGELLSAAEQAKRELEAKVLAARGQQIDRRIDRQRSGNTVRPGSPIYVKILDADRDTSNGRDEVYVKLTTSTGDVIDAFALSETGEHTAEFLGKIETDVPLPRASASDTAESKEPAVLINSTRNEDWVSLPDGKAPKWVDVDTMTSNLVSRVILEGTDTDRIRQISLKGRLADDPIELAAFPQRTEKIKGGVKLYNRKSEVRQTSPAGLRDVFEGRGVKGVRTELQSGPAFDRDKTSMRRRGGAAVTRMRGAFWLDSDRTVELKFLQKPSDDQVAYLYIDGQGILGGKMTAENLERTRRLDLLAGAHDYELLIYDTNKDSKVTVGIRQDDGTYKPMPADWFDAEKHAGLRKYLAPKGIIEVQGNNYVCVMREPVRLRSIRWVFENFTGNAVSARAIRILDETGKEIVPVEKDFTVGKTNQLLEVAPGDKINITYEDVKRVRSGSPLLSTQLNATYQDGEIELAYEEVSTKNDRKQSELFPAMRFRIGDQLMIRLKDNDADLTAQRDTVDVTVTTAGGEKITLKALETGEASESGRVHTGTFAAVLRTGAKTEGDQIAVRRGDVITAAYLDKENTDPGVPVERTFEVEEAGQSHPQPTIYRTRTELVEDDSEEAQRQIKRLKLKSQTDIDPVIYEEVVVARHPDYESKDANAAKRVGKDGPIRCSVKAPVIFDVKHPMLALHEGCTYSAYIFAESDAKANGGRPRRVLEVPMRLHGPGTAAKEAHSGQVRVEARQSTNELYDSTEAGTFSAAVRLQMGSPGDEIRQDVQGAFSRRRDRPSAPTLVVRGSDTVVLLFKDQLTDEVIKVPVELRSDARLELLESSYTAHNEKIHLGEKFYVRLTDPDQDVTDGLDEVVVAVASQSGSRTELTLRETLPHSGVFTASIEPVYAKQAETTTRPASLTTVKVNFGDSITFSYVDEESLLSDEPRTIATEGSIFFGADAELAVFTKAFKDPEMAVKTRFLMAEALFELAKDHRKLGRKEQAAEGLARGRRILEEAMQDYPNTKLESQAQFLLANLAEELGDYDEAIRRFAHVIATWPNSAFAPRSQLHKAICFEKLEEYEQATEEYVKLVYVYPDSQYVADATVRLGKYYHDKGRFGTAGEVFYRFQQRNPAHDLAAKALFLSGQCYFKMKDYAIAAQRFDELAETYKDDKDVRPKAMYFGGEAYFLAKDYAKSYQTFTKITWDYPESKWAKMARGRLTEKVFERIE